MLKSRLFWKVFAAYAALTLGSAAAFAVIISERQKELVIEQVQQRLRSSAIVLRSSLPRQFRDGPSPELQRVLQQIAGENGNRITLVGNDGTVFGDSVEDPDVMDNHLDRPEFQEAHETGFAIVQRESTTFGGPMMFYIVRVDDDSPLGFVRMAVPLTDVEARITSVNRMIWGMAATISLIALAITYVIAGRITQPLESLTSAVQAMAHGDFKQNVAVTSRDELGMLGSAFNALSQELVVRIDELQGKTRQLEENSKLLSTVLGGMIEGVIAVDASERIVFANDAAQSLVEMSSSEFVGRPIWEAVRNSKIQRVIRQTLQGKHQQPVELDLPRTQAVVALRATRLPGSPCPGVVLVLHDVTELRRLENLRREFVSNVSHELKTPLTSIQAYTETLLGGAIDDPENNREFLNRIEEQAERLHALILDLLSLARIESGQEMFEVVALPLHDKIQACVVGHAAVAESNGLTLTLEPPNEELRVRADVEGLRTILDNLVDNAIKYTPQGGRVTIRWRSEDSMALIEVEDTGMGIADEHKARIFERFYRADRARSRELGGTGLGLSIVKHLAQVFGGRVDVSSQLGKGSTFSVRLPLEKSEPAHR